MPQQTLFATFDAAQIVPIDPHVDADDVPRLTGQNAAILARLERGPATNSELAKLSLKYTSRISDLRVALARKGFAIVYDRGEGGLNTYRLVKT